MANTRFSGGFLEPGSIFEGGSLIFVLEKCGQTIITEHSFCDLMDRSYAEITPFHAESFYE